MRIAVQGLAYPSLDDLAWLRERLEEAVPGATVVVLPAQLQPNIEWFDWSRMQYRSELVLQAARELRRGYGVDVLVIVAGVDAYADGLNFVFGEAVLGGGVAVVYTPRLATGPASEDRKLYRERLLKEVLHELGHALGLQHCTTSGCVMNFSNSIADVDAKQYRFCRRCAATLASRGVRVARAYVLEA